MCHTYLRLISTTEGATDKDWKSVFENIVCVILFAFDKGAIGWKLKIVLNYQFLLFPIVPKSGVAW